MAYTYITQYDSPNYTPADEARSVWGRPRSIEKIAIHWWDDPLNNPSFQGTINTLINPARQASAHFVATGTDRKVACLVDIPNAAWSTASANPYTISIECDPRCRDEDYDVVAELVAELRREYGDLPLMRHSEVVATRCPGNYDLSRINAVAATKNAGAEFGTSTSKVTLPPTPPTPTPDPTPPFIGYKVVVDGQQIGAYKLDKNAYQKWVDTGRKGKITDQTGIDVTVTIVTRFEPVTPVPDPTPTPLPPTNDPLDRIGAKLDENNDLLKQILALIQWLVDKINSIFK